MITDYRYYPFTTHVKSESIKDKARENVSNIKELMDWSKKYLKNWEKS
jgi:NAD+--asparagine ADP-ribosyltransferase